MKLTIAPLSTPLSITAAAQQAIIAADRLFIQTEQHPSAYWLKDSGIEYGSMDDLYESCYDFDELNAAIAQRLLEDDTDTVYAPVGRGVGSALLEAIRTRADETGAKLSILSASGYAEAALCAAGQPTGSARILSANELPCRIDTSVPLCIEEVDTPIRAGEVKLALGEYYPDEHGVTLACMDERGAYERIFNRLDLKYVPVHAMAGPMGGFESEEFLAPMEIGEDTFAQSPSGKAWNVEALTTPEPEAIDFTATPAAEKRPTPDAATIDKMVEFANANHPRSDGRDWQASDILKNVVIAVMHPQDEDHDEPWRELVVVGVPGDRTVDMKRLEAQFTPAEIEEATDEDLKKHPELVKGYIGPMALGPQARDGKKAENASETGDALRYLIDAHVARGSAWFTGADEQDVDYYDLVYGRDFEADGTVEAVQVRHGDMSPDGSGPLSFERGVEIGQVFQLGLKYSNALGLKVLDQNGKTVPVWMGSYGIGVSRVMACIAETHHDEKGLAWPAVIAPAQVHVVATGKDAAAFEAAEQLIGELEAKGIEVIFDDRKKVSPGVKFKDAELIGVPIIAVAGRDTVNNGTIEVRDRNGENAEAVPVADAAQAIADRVAALLK